MAKSGNISSTAELIPPQATLPQLREIAAGCRACATVHPSSILRAPDDESCHEEMRKFVEDLKAAAKLKSPGSIAA